MPPGIQRGFPSGDIWQCQTTYLTAISGKFAISIQWVKPDMLLDCLPMFRTVPTTIIIWSQMAAAVSMRNISSVIIVIIIFISNAVLHTWPSVCRVCFVVSLCQWTKYFPTKMSCFFSFSTCKGLFSCNKVQQNFVEHWGTGTVLDTGAKEGSSIQIKGTTWCVLKFWTNLKLSVW